jgi:uncharacterized membrane protein
MSLLNIPLQVVANLPPAAATILLAALPIGELRGALPVALVVYKIPLFYAVLLVIIGNILPVYFLLIFWERASNYLSRRSPLFDSILKRLVLRTRNKLHDQVQRYGVWALAVFVAIPLPVTGAWTGSLAAFIFGLPRRQAFLAILLGLIISAIIVASLTLGTTYVINFFISTIRK